LSRPSEILAELAQREIRIWKEGDRLRLSGPRDRMTAELRADLASHKAALLALLASPAPAGAPPDSGAAARGWRIAGVVPPDGDQPASIAWRADGLPAGAGRVPVDAAARAEIDSLAARLRANPLPVPSLRAGDFDLPACRALMERARHSLDEGPGFAVIDRLDLARMGRDEATSVYWILLAMLARPVAQKWDGTMIREVVDLGRPSLRAVDTTDDMNFHTDNSFNLCPPEYVGLLCLQKSRSGGVSRIVSFATVHDALRRRSPDLLARLYGDFVFDRQNEHPPGDTPVVRRPIFATREGRLCARMSRFHVRHGYARCGAEVDAEGEAAMEAMETVMNEPGVGLDLAFEPGQIQILDNRRIGHKRTRYSDWPEPERKRRLVRMWLRDAGRPFYNG